MGTEWNSSYSVQVGQMDEQHKKLFTLISNLQTAMKEGKGHDAAPKAIKELLDYTVTHFTAEEKHMSSLGYSGLAEQKKAHEAFITKVKQFQADISAGKMGLAITIVSFLNDWLVSHIQKIDKKYGPYFNEKGIK